MSRYVSHGLQQKDALPDTLGTDLHERGAVLLRLLSDRAVLRVLCAPPLYGKSVVAFQYAELAFPRERVTWVRAADPRFLCDLDDGSFESRVASESALVVFDDVARLSDARLIALRRLVASLLGSGREVLVTTRAFELAESLDPSAVVVGARDLLLDLSEVGLCDLRSIGASSQSLIRCAPPILLDRAQGRRRFFSSLLDAPPGSSFEALATLSLVLGTGVRADLDSLVVGTDEAAHLLVDRVPHAGFARRDARFTAFSLAATERLLLLRTHLEALVEHSPHGSEERYVETLAAVLHKAGDHALLSRVLATCLSSDARRRFCIEYDLPSDWDNLQASGMGAGGSDASATGEGRLLGVTCAERVDPVDVRLFGRFELSRDGRPVPEHGEVRRKARVLIALMVVNHDKELPCERLASAMWPGATEPRARSSFYNLWGYVRGVLAETEEERQALRISGRTVSLRGLPLQSDVIVLDDLVSALDACDDPVECASLLRRIAQVYRGPLLPGFENAQLEAYRSAYQNKALDALVRGSDLLMRRGDVHGALRYASFAFHVDATREDVCYQAMKAQKMLGQFAGAISTFMRCRRALVERFGIDGSRRLDSLYEEILRETSSL